MNQKKFDEKSMGELSVPKNRKSIEEVIEEEKNLYKCIYNKFNFKWNTPKYNYDINVKAPEAIFQVGGKIFKSYINIELIFFLIENNFKNWDFYISHYIFSYKECKKNMSKLTSKSMENLDNKNLDEFPLLKSSLNKTKIKEINNFNKERIQQITEKSKTFEFLYTDKYNNNYIKIFHNFEMITRSKSISSKKKFIFDFNFIHMRILNNILKIQGLNYFLKKLIYIDKENSTIKFRYDELCSLSNDQYKILEKYEPNISGAQTCLRMKEKNKDIINITLNFPVLETIKYNNKNYDNCFESDYDEVIFEGLPLNILDELCRTDFNEWPNILLKNISR